MSVFLIYKEPHTLVVVCNSEVAVERSLFFQLQAMRLVLAAVRDTTFRAWKQLLLLAIQQVGVDRAAIVRPDGAVIVAVGDGDMYGRVEIPRELLDLEYGFAIRPTPGVGWDAAVPLWDGEHLIGLLLLDDTSRGRDFSDEEEHVVSMYADVFAGVLALRPSVSKHTVLPSREDIVRAVDADAVEHATVIVPSVSVSQPERVTNSTPLPLPGPGMAKRAVEQLAHALTPYVCVMIGLKGMKVLNALGREHGDEALRKAANTLSAVVSNTILLGRYGRDVFLVAGTWEQMGELTPAYLEACLQDVGVHAVGGLHRTDERDIRLASEVGMLSELVSNSLDSTFHAMIEEKRRRVGVDSQREGR